MQEDEFLDRLKLGMDLMAQGKFLEVIRTQPHLMRQGTQTFRYDR